MMDRRWGYVRHLEAHASNLSFQEMETFRAAIVHICLTHKPVQSPDQAGRLVAVKLVHMETVVDFVQTATAQLINPKKVVRSVNSVQQITTLIYLIYLYNGNLWYGTWMQYLEK